MSNNIVNLLKKKSVIVIHGDDPQTMKDYLDPLNSWVRDNPGENHQIERIDGNAITIDSLTNTLRTIPIFSQMLYVVIDQPYQKIKTESDQEKFVQLISKLPETIKVILMIDDHTERGKWANYDKKAWLKKWVQKADKEQVEYLKFIKPKLKDMRDWIQKRTKDLGGTITPQAAHVLAEHVGVDTSFAFQEIQKLMIYVNFEREIELEDVETISIPGTQQDVFKMVDAIARGNLKGALDNLHGLLDTEEPIMLFSMIVRQFRLLIQAKSLIDLGYSEDETNKVMKQHPFTIKTLYQQARYFSQEKLERIYHHLLDIDVQIKTGEVEPDLAMDLFISKMAK